MKQVHIECLPDELLVSKLGFERKFVTHHQGKSRIFDALKRKTNQLAMVDEDPGSTITSYEKSLKLVEVSQGIKFCTDQSGNKIFILNGKLEDWIVAACKQHKIKLSDFGLPEKPDDLHDVINQKLSNFDKLINKLIDNKNPAILKLKHWLN
jgi:hypothetical protein